MTSWFGFISSCRYIFCHTLHIFDLFSFMIIGVHHNAKFWPEPLEYRPERFLKVCLHMYSFFRTIHSLTHVRYTFELTLRMLNHCDPAC